MRLPGLRSLCFCTASEMAWATPELLPWNTNWMSSPDGPSSAGSGSPAGSPCCRRARSRPAARARRPALLIEVGREAELVEPVLAGGRERSRQRVHVADLDRYRPRAPRAGSHATATAVIRIPMMRSWSWTSCASRWLACVGDDRRGRRSALPCHDGVLPRQEARRQAGGAARYRSPEVARRCMSWLGVLHDDGEGTCRLPVGKRRRLLQQHGPRIDGARGRERIVQGPLARRSIRGSRPFPCGGSSWFGARDRRLLPSTPARKSSAARFQAAG